MARHEPAYWSACCGQRIEYIGFYRCSACHQRAEIGTLSQGRPGVTRAPEPPPPPAPVPSLFDEAHVRRAARPSRKRTPPPPDQLALFTVDEAS